jgi:hypothetical protein
VAYRGESDGVIATEWAAGVELRELSGERRTGERWSAGMGGSVAVGHVGTRFGRRDVENGAEMGFLARKLERNLRLGLKLAE